MATLLIVDDDRNFLLSLADGLRSLEEDLEILTAPNGEEAVSLLESSEIDLIVSDIKMPKMDGFELLAHVSRNFPGLPVIIITAFGTPEIEKNMSAMGSFQYLEKPLDFNMLIESIYTGLEAKSSGYLKGISLPSFLQLVEMENKTCTLKIKEGERTGFLYFKKGELLNAETEDTDGEEAALDIISWEAAALFNELTGYMNKALKGAGFPILGRFYLLDLADKKMAIVIPMGDYGWGMLVDGAKAQLGLLLNIALPRAIDVFEEAIAG